MKTVHSTALIALVTATTLGFSVVAPAIAQGPTDGPPQVQRQKSDHGPMQGRPGFGPRGGFNGDAVFDFSRGAEALEVALVRLSHRLDLTPEQQALFDEFRDTAVDAASGLEAQLASMRADTTSGDNTALDISARFEQRIAFERAKLDAMEAVQPSLTAFFESLTEEQLNSLRPQRGNWTGPRGDGPRGAPGQPPLDAPQSQDDADSAPQG